MKSVCDYNFKYSRINAMFEGLLNNCLVTECDLLNYWPVKKDQRFYPIFFGLVIILHCLILLRFGGK